MAKKNNKIIAITCDYNHVFALDDNGNIYGCGRNEYGQLGTGNYSNYKTFVKYNLSFFKYSIFF